MGLVEVLEMEGIHTAPFRACIADVSRELKVAAFAQREIFDNVQVLYILSKGLMLSWCLVAITRVEKWLTNA